MFLAAFLQHRSLVPRQNPFIGVASFRPLLILAAALLAPLQNSQGQGILLKDYTTRDGLPDSRVAPIIQDQKGFLWFGTQAGLTRYDGQKFENFGPAREIPGIFGRDIMEDHAGAIWFAFSGFSQGGLVRVSEGTMTTFLPAQGMDSLQATSVVEDRNGDVFVATERGIGRIHFEDSTRSSWRLEKQSDSLVLALHIDRRGRLLVATGSGLYEYANGSYRKRFLPSKVKPLWHVRPYAMYDDPREGLWVGGYYGAYLVTDTGVSIFTRADGLPERGVWCFCRDLHDNLWVGTMDGLYRAVRSRAVYRFVKEPSFGNAVVYAMRLDREGNVWIASAPGLRKILASDFVLSFPGRDVLSTPGIGPIRQSAAGAVFFGSRTTALYVLENGRLRHQGEFGPHARLTITDILPEVDGRVWLGCWRGGLVRLDKESYRIYDKESGLPSNNVHALARTRNGSILVGTSAGIAIHNAEGSTAPLHDPELDRLTIFDIKPTHRLSRGLAPLADTLLLGTSAGVKLLALNRESIAGIRSLDEAALKGRIVYEILVDSRGRAWFGTDGGGLVLFDGSATTVYTTDDGLAGNRIFALAEDSLGNIWAGTSSGLSWFDGQGFRTLTHDQGFGEIGVHGLLTDRDGSLWVSNFPAVSKVKPFRFVGSNLPPPVYLTDVTADTIHLSIPRFSRLSPDPGIITFRFACPSFTDESAVRYKYRLEGFDRDWSQPVKTREVRYTHLPPRTYTFEVVARNSSGTWSTTPAEFSFEIAPPVWQRWWFVGAIALLAFSVSYGLYRYRVARLLELERTRSRIAMDLHDDIGSSLTRISVMTEVAQRQAFGDPQGTLRHLSAIGDTAREVIDALGDIVWSVDPKHDNLQNVVSRIVQFGQETCEGSEIAFETDLGDSLETFRLSPENRRDVFLVFKEAINNVVRHSGAGLVRFRVHPTPKGVLLELSDDGSGIPAATERTGRGLESMSARGARAGLSFAVQSSQGRGTTVSLEVKTV